MTAVEDMASSKFHKAVVIGLAPAGCQEARAICLRESQQAVTAAHPHLQGNGPRCGLWRRRAGKSVQDPCVDHVGGKKIGVVQAQIVHDMASRREAVQIHPAAVDRIAMLQFGDGSSQRRIVY